MLGGGTSSIPGIAAFDEPIVPHDSSVAQPRASPTPCSPSITWVGSRFRVLFAGAALRRCPIPYTRQMRLTWTPEASVSSALLWGTPLEPFYPLPAPCSPRLRQTPMLCSPVVPPGWRLVPRQSGTVGMVPALRRQHRPWSRLCKPPQQCPPSGGAPGNLQCTHMMRLGRVTASLTALQVLTTLTAQPAMTSANQHPDLPPIPGEPVS